MDLSEVQNYPLLTNHCAKLDMLKRQLDIEVQSYDELKALADDTKTRFKCGLRGRPFNPSVTSSLTGYASPTALVCTRSLRIFMDHKGAGLLTATKRNAGIRHG